MRDAGITQHRHHILHGYTCFDDEEGMNDGHIARVLQQVARLVPRDVACVDWVVRRGGWSLGRTKRVVVGSSGGGPGSELGKPHRPTIIEMNHVTSVGVPGADVGEEHASHADRRGSDDEQQPQQQKAEPVGGDAGGRGSSGGSSGGPGRWQQRHPANVGASHLFLHGGMGEAWALCVYLEVS